MAQRIIIVEDLNVRNVEAIVTEDDGGGSVVSPDWSTDIGDTDGHFSGTTGIA